MLGNFRRCFALALLSLLAFGAQAAPFAYIADHGAARVTVIDTATNTVITSSSSAGFLGLGVNPAGTRLYAANAVVDTATNAVVTTITFPGPSPSLQGIAINPAGTRVYYTDTNNARMFVVDT